MTRTTLFGALAALLMTTVLPARAEENKLKTVTARAIKLQVPESWKPVKVTSEFRAAQFEIPGMKKDDEAADLVVYHFGGPTGGIKANVTRWIGQFQEKGREVTLRQGTSAQGAYILADVSGTWNKPDGPPFARKTIETPNSRVIGVILITEAEGMKDYYFFKLSGPDPLVESQAKQLRSSFGGNLETEKPLLLEDEAITALRRLQHEISGKESAAVFTGLCLSVVQRLSSLRARECRESV